MDTVRMNAASPDHVGSRLHQCDRSLAECVAAGQCILGVAV